MVEQPQISVCELQCLVPVGHTWYLPACLSGELMTISSVKTYFWGFQLNSLACKSRVLKLSELAIHFFVSVIPNTSYVPRQDRGKRRVWRKGRKPHAE